MLATQFTEAATAAHNSAALDNLSRLLWRAHALGKIGDIDATAAAEAVGRRRAALASYAYPKRQTPASAQRRKPPTSPDRRASLERRRRQAMSGIVPAKLAAAFTPGELAALSVIGWQIRRHGACSLPIDAIAALAGVCRTVVKRALRQARLVGMALVRERRIPRRKSLTNVITAIGNWSAWLRIGGTKIPSTEKLIEKGHSKGASARVGPASEPLWRTLQPHTRPGAVRELDARRL
jgi:hypothetical protein